MNNNPNIIAINPVNRPAAPIAFADFLKSHPIIAEDIPKKIKLTPTIIETSSELNIGKKMNIKPRIMDIIPKIFFVVMFFTSILCKLIIIYD